MLNIKSIGSIVLLMLSFTLFSVAQESDSSSEETSYIFRSEVHIKYPYLSISRSTLEEANTFSEINRWHKSSWVAKYNHVEVTTIHDGKAIVTPGIDSTLTTKQKELMNSADYGSEIKVSVLYMPKNELRQNEEHEMGFSFTVDPDQAAQFEGGNAQIEKHLKKHILDKVSKSNFRQYNLATVTFTVSETGQVINPEIFTSTDHEATDKILLESICSMPNWTPAAYGDGTKVSQDYALTVGDMNSCVINMINIRKNIEDYQE